MSSAYLPMTTLRHIESNAWIAEVAGARACDCPHDSTS